MLLEQAQTFAVGNFYPIPSAARDGVGAPITSLQGKAERASDERGSVPTSSQTATGRGEMERDSRVL